MKADQYFVLSISEDGDVRFHVYTEEQLLDAMNNEWPHVEAERAIPHAPQSTDLNEWPGLHGGKDTVIIKGQIIAPIAKTEVVKWILP